MLIDRFVVRLIRLWFGAVERGRVDGALAPSGNRAADAPLSTALLWLFALVVAYPYMPGSQTEAFKGVGVFSA